MNIAEPATDEADDAVSLEAANATTLTPAATAYAAPLHNCKYRWLQAPATN
jgi:hypothetical protein